jgi:hypothetical protein
MTNFDPSALVVLLLGTSLVHNVDAFAGLKRPTTIKGSNGLHMVCWSLIFDVSCVSFLDFVPAGGRESYQRFLSRNLFVEFLMSYQIVLKFLQSVMATESLETFTCCSWFVNCAITLVREGS